MRHFRDGKKLEKFLFGEQVTSWLYLFIFKSLIIFVLFIAGYFIVSPHHNCVYNWRAALTEKKDWNHGIEIKAIKQCSNLPF